MAHIGIIGAGMAGLSCADRLARQGHDVRLFDKGRGPGGRMSTRRLNIEDAMVQIDHGAQYFTARDPRFIEMVEDWFERGIIARWPVAGKEAWVGVPKMNSVLGDLCARHNVRFEAVVRSLTYSHGQWEFSLANTREGPFDAAILAIPAEQAAAVLALQDMEMAGSAFRARSRPCWAGMYVFEERQPIDDDVLQDVGEIAWAARNGSKPGREGPESWIVQARPGWSEEHLECANEAVADKLFEELARAAACKLAKPVATMAHRWRFAMSIGTGEHSLWNAQKRLGVCGDWLLGPRVECAWLSGYSLGNIIAAALSEGPRGTSGIESSDTIATP